MPHDTMTAPPKGRMVKRLRSRILAWITWITGGGMILLLGLIYFELQSSRLQAIFLSRVAKQLDYSLKPGASDSIFFPLYGPADERKGYVMIPAFTETLQKKGFQVEAQSRFSAKMLELTSKRWIYPIYDEKPQAGLTLLDRAGKSLYSIKFPMKVYPAFDSIPDEVVKTLLFIENKTILDPDYPYRNPSVEWNRLGKAGIEFFLARLGLAGNAPGGSTLATQLEKYLHSEDGRTPDPLEKLRQMGTATLRAYHHGEKTEGERKRIVLQYVNTVPLAALPGYGEVNGLGDGLLAWYAAPIDSLNRHLRRPMGSRLSEEGVDSAVYMPAMGQAYRQALNLFISQRRPSYYLLENRAGLKTMGDTYLNLLSREGVISPQLRDAALASQPELMRRAANFSGISYVERKAINAIRTNLLGLLGLPRLYDLDRLDLEVESTLDKRSQGDVIHMLRKLRDPAFVDSAKLNSFRLLEKGDPSQVIYSFTLYEHKGGRNHLRVQADNFDQPLNINEGVKLDLGSTAKLRTLVNYLEIIAALHKRYAANSPKELRALQVPVSDRLTAWVLEYLSTHRGASLMETLEAAMDRPYSANPGERFFTGGGLHTFGNFNSRDNHRMVPVREAFRHSINLPFIRIMRDIVNYYMFQIPGSTAALLQDSTSSSHREKYLIRFAEREGQVFLSRFYRKYRGKKPSEMLELFFHGVRSGPQSLATAYLTINPRANINQFAAFIRAQRGDTSKTVSAEDSLRMQKNYEELYKKHFLDDFSLADRGYVAGVHPLELWLVAYKYQHPIAEWKEVKETSKPHLQDIYKWLFKTKHRHAQDIRIRSILEMEAFLEIHRAWQRLGYPFGSLVPSYATSIGSSADRPMALANLVGILVNDGIRYPSISIKKLRFAKDTPYETHFNRTDTIAERVLPQEVAQIVRKGLLDVVEKGTAVRGYKAFPLPDGTYIPLGGKTGTGDQRFDTYGAGGALVESRVVNRTATFVFFLGNRFYGTLTAYVAGEKAEGYGFTSSLPVQLLKDLGPSLMPLLSEASPKALSSTRDSSSIVITKVSNPSRNSKSDSASAVLPPEGIIIENAR